jgi:DDE superfamily endonuclease
VQDEADLALLPTLSRCWTKRGQQRKIPAPGDNHKRSVSAATDWRDGGLVWRTDERRCARQFCALADACVARSRARGRRAVLLADNAQAHRPGQTGQVHDLLARHASQLELVFLPAYAPDLNPQERLWRCWRPLVTHNHTRTSLDQLEADSDACFRAWQADPSVVLSAIGSPFRPEPLSHAPLAA